MQLTTRGWNKQNEFTMHLPHCLEMLYTSLVSLYSGVYVFHVDITKEARFTRANLGARDTLITN